ncbi:MAG: PH domain-containing protein [Streptosporangiaceae bacterium]
MSLPRDLLGDDEEVVLDLHPHWKALVVPAAVFVLTCGVASFLVALVPGSAEPTVRWVIAGLAVAVVIVWSVVPLLRWRATSFVLTTHRLVTREGLVTRHGHDIPLSRVNDVSFSYTLPERVLGCGTLVVESAGERGELVLPGVPYVEVVQRELYRLIEEGESRPDGSHHGGASRR